jgi:hypothetical protein
MTRSVLPSLFFFAATFTEYVCVQAVVLYVVSPAKCRQVRGGADAQGRTDRSVLCRHFCAVEFAWRTADYQPAQADVRVLLFCLAPSPY